MLLDTGVGCVRVCDRKGIITAQEEGQTNQAKLELGRLTNPENESGGLADALIGADVFIGVSAPRVLTQDMIKSMANDPIIFAMANPEPEIDPRLAKEAGAAVIGTGRSDYPNQINNVLIFPGLFKGALAARANCITKEMKVAAAYALAGIVTEEELAAGTILPAATRKDVGPVIAEAVRAAWRE
jgi:malate dehydrogenase (oxaloacetate-decarboxylating)